MFFLVFSVGGRKKWNIGRCLFLSLIVLLFFPGCAIFSPQHLGISDDEWEGYDKAQQLALKRDYRQIQDGATTFIDFQQNGAVKRTPLMVSIYGGKVIVPPFVEWFAYRPVAFAVAPESCVEKKIRQIDGAQQIELQACYRRGVLFIDPSRFDKNKVLGSIRFHYSPIWEEGFIYRNVNSSGYVRLRDVNVEVKQINEDLF